MPLWIRRTSSHPATDRHVRVRAGVDIGTLAATVVPGHPGTWILSSGAVDAAGRSTRRILRLLLFAGPVRDQGGPVRASAVAMPGKRRHIQAAVTYQPGSRYWPLQGIDTGIFLALAIFPHRVLLSGGSAAGGPDRR